MIGHLLEARRRLLWWIASLLVIFFALFPFQNRVFDFIATPMLKRLPAGSSMIATSVTSPFMTPLKLTLMTALFLSIPVLLYHLWRFISPALYKSERRMFFPLLVSSVVLFYCGVAFAYFVLFPVAFAFLTSVAPAGVKVMTDINAYLDFVLTIFFAFGLAFEVPVAIVLATWAGFTTPGKLKKLRPYALVGSFVVGMILSPPDVVSMTLLSVPIYLLYEAGMLMARILVPGARQVDEQREQQQGVR
ncbi:MAG: twin-arginine translocase subunit TatC [Gammaproteobacteria bacterium]|nr:twin-arginine translocase subunit TatC [Gammaproteobacteria bacterium]MBU6509456.1 twin-arginine translocase subunit TatC [Gammaproteobacteria bacterium]MDE1983452.1 twin-arginine translocase subunit TatC [Gammaproteobacteria bacterium]MDE2108512.1 twin-arginine translocase subunit TatC [Gammaproteobacteria bacterium]